MHGDALAQASESLKRESLDQDGDAHDIVESAEPSPNISASANTRTLFT